MLTIRRAQMEALADAMRERFVAAAAPSVRERHRQATASLDDAALAARVGAAVDRCRRHGIVQRALVHRFIDLTFELGADFDTAPEHPWAAKILNDRALDPHDKLDWLEAEALELAGLALVRESWPEALSERGERAVRGTVREARALCRAGGLDGRANVLAALRALYAKSGGTS